MKKLFLSCSCIALGATAATAGSYEAAPAEPEVIVQPVIVEMRDTPWQGAYAGATLSWGSGKATAKGDLATALAAGGFGPTLGKPEGITGAIHGGYDWQTNNLVYGFGGEYVFGRYKDKLLGLSDTEVGIKDMATLYGRLGYAASDVWMVYGTLGYTWATGLVEIPGGSATFDVDGVTYGLGTEYRFSDKWSGVAEYTFADFGTLSGSDGTVKADLNQVKVGLNYRF